MSPREVVRGEHGRELTVRTAEEARFAAFRLRGERVVKTEGISHGVVSPERSSAANTTVR
jgi:hypothetical protein